MIVVSAFVAVLAINIGHGSVTAENDVVEILRRLGKYYVLLKPVNNYSDAIYIRHYTKSST